MVVIMPPDVGPTVPKVEIKTEESVAIAAGPDPAKSLARDKRVWNTKNLGLRIGADAVAAICAASLVAPVIAMIDK